VRQPLSLVATLVCVWMASARAQESPRAVQICPKPTKGDKFTLQIERTRSRTCGNGVPGSLLRLVDVEVLEPTPAGPVVSLATRAVKLTGPGAEEAVRDPALKALNDLVTRVPLHVTLSADYEMIGLQNLEQVRRARDKALDIAAEAMIQDPAERAKVRGAMRNLLASEQSILQQFTREMLPYFNVLGFSVPTGDPAKAQTQVQGPYDDEPLPATTVAEVQSINEKAGEASVVFRTTVDPSALQKRLLAVIRRMAKETGVPPPREADVPLSRLKDETLVVVDLKTQWPRFVAHTRTLKDPAGTRTYRVTTHRLPAGSAFRKEPAATSQPVTQPGKP